MPKIMINNQNFSGFAPQYDDIKSVMKHDNLLINGWFSVNQRGVSTSIANNYWIDMWVSVNTLITVNSDKSLHFGVEGRMFQRVEDIASLYGHVMTMSVMLTDGTVYSGTATMHEGIDDIFLDDENFKLSKNSGGGFNIVSKKAVDVRAIKLEYGTASTLANDTAPNYQMELLKCQRYYYQGIMPVYFQKALQASRYHTVIYYPIRMRIRPSITVGNDSSGYNVVINGVNLYHYNFETLYVEPNCCVVGVNSSTIPDRVGQFPNFIASAEL